MKESVLDILIHLFENFLDADDEPGTCLFTGQPSPRRGVFAKAY